MTLEEPPVKSEPQDLGYREMTASVTGYFQMSWGFAGTHLPQLFLSALSVSRAVRVSMLNSPVRPISSAETREDSDIKQHDFKQ